MDVAVGSELGIWQRRNGDAHLSEALAPGLALFGVADGFGALGRGTPTAPLALGCVRDFLRRRHRVGALLRNASSNDLRSILLAALDYANARLYEQSGSHDDYVAGGTSLTVVLVANHHAFVGHVGDARAYLVRLGRLELLTADDAMAADVVTSAKSPLPARSRAQSLLWRSLGTQPKSEASIAYVELLAGDRIALCTDGIYRTVDADEICDALATSESAGEAVTRILGIAKVRSGLDSGTLVVGTELLADSVETPAGTPRGEGQFRTIVALVMLVCAALFLAYFVYRESALPSTTGTVTGDHR